MKKGLKDFLDNDGSDKAVIYYGHGIGSDKGGTSTFTPANYVGENFEETCFFLEDFAKMVVDSPRTRRVLLFVISCSACAADIFLNQWNEQYRREMEKFTGVSFLGPEHNVFYPRISGINVNEIYFDNSGLKASPDSISQSGKYSLQCFKNYEHREELWQFNKAVINVSLKMTAENRAVLDAMFAEEERLITGLFKTLTSSMPVIKFPSDAFKREFSRSVSKNQIQPNGNQTVFDILKTEDPDSDFHLTLIDNGGFCEEVHYCYRIGKKGAAGINQKWYYQLVWDEQQKKLDWAFNENHEWEYTEKKTKVTGKDNVINAILKTRFGDDNKSGEYLQLKKLFQDQKGAIFATDINENFTSVKQLLTNRLKFSLGSTGIVKVLGLFRADINNQNSTVEGCKLSYNTQL